MATVNSRNFFAPLEAGKDPDDRSSYSYDVLPKASDLIRLLSLEPAHDWSLPLKGTLRAVSLARPPAYKALSYVWGTQYKDSESDNSDTGSDGGDEPSQESRHRASKFFPCEITLAGHTVKIGRHLYNSLKRIRDSMRNLLVWADAICIDQLNTSERNHQVKMMTTIYSTADEVYVCFDDDETVNSYFSNVCPSIQECAKYWRGRSSTPAKIQLALKEPIFDMLVVDLVDTGWWNRAWTAQEFILGCKIKLFFFSDNSLTTEDLADWISYLEDYDRLKAIGCVEDKNDKYRSRQRKRLVGRNIHSANSSELTWSIHIKPLLMLRQHMQNAPEIVSTLVLVAFSRYRRASEVRDKIFAFLGPCPDMLDLVDYNVPVESCFEQFVALHRIV